MTVQEAIDLIRPAVTSGKATWADFGAGTGLFTRALAHLLGAGARVIAVDRDPHVFNELNALADHAPASGAGIVPVRGDFLELASLSALEEIRLDGALFANALHYAADVVPVLSDVAYRLTNSGRIVVVEYDRNVASPWVPYPIPPDRLRMLAAGAGLDYVQVVGRRESRFGGAMYSAVLARSAAR